MADIVAWYSANTRPSRSLRCQLLLNSRTAVPSFVSRLVRAGLLARDLTVHGLLQGTCPTLSRRSMQRHFLHATGIAHGTYRQIERARYATVLLTRGFSIPDTVLKTGYFDQAHLTRSLRRWIGETPARLRQHAGQLSFLYKTSPTR